MRATVASVGLAHPFEVGFEEAPALLKETGLALEAAGVTCAETGVVMSDAASVRAAAARLRGLDFDMLMVCVATWSEDNHLLDLLAYVDAPMIIRAYPARETGSLCCAHQIGAVFTELGRPYEYIYGEASCPASAAQAREMALAHALAGRMKHAKVGAIGGRVKGMTEIAYDEFDLKQKLGARVVNLGEQELLEAVAATGDAEAAAALAEFRQRPFCCKSGEADLLESMKYYLAMKKLVAEYELSCLAVKCYTKYMGKVCLGYSLLAEDGVMCACEGDVTNALSMQMLYELSEKPVNNTDLLYLDEEKNTILYAHCGSSGFAIAGSPVEIAPVRLAKSGCCSLFTAMPGEVTLLNMVGHGAGFRASTMEGEAVPCGMEFPGNPAVVRHPRPVRDISDDIMRRGVGHHWMVGYGGHESVIQRFCAINGINHIAL